MKIHTVDFQSASLFFPHLHLTKNYHWLLFGALMFNQFFLNFNVLEFTLLCWLTLINLVAAAGSCFYSTCISPWIFTDIQNLFAWSAGQDSSRKRFHITKETSDLLKITSKLHNTNMHNCVSFIPGLLLGMVMVDGDELPFSFLAVTVMIYSSVGSRLRARLSLL